MGSARRLTADLPGTGGRAKETAEDFRVEEIPLYPASGAGEHLFLTIEKRGVTTLDLVQRLARALGVRRNDIGYAGMKDARAVTVQTISVPRVAEPGVACLAIENVRVLAATAHKNKLKLGHLSGNRFQIRLRGVVPDAADRARAILDVLTRRGVPNRFGPQRFGARGASATLGRAVLARDGKTLFRAIVATSSEPDAALAAFDAGDLAAARERLHPRDRDARASLEFVQRFGGDCDAALARYDRKLLDLYVSALQAEIFNRVLDARLHAIDAVEPGDLAWLHRNGAVFAVADAEAAARESPRVASLEISPSGPLFGSRMTAPSGRPAELEAAALAAHALSRSDFDRAPLPGARRPLRIPLGDARAERDGAAEQDLIVSFALPAGGYATVVLDELTKAEDPAHT